jgi:queuine tRNA-ribosyltransferase
MSKKYFYSKSAGKIALPIFFPDATKGVVRTLDSKDIENTKTEGVLVNTYHLLKNPGIEIIKKYKGVKSFMNFHGGTISDSGGFQIGSLIKKNPRLGKITDEGARFKMPGEKAVFITPESSIQLQMELGTDMVVALDDFDAPNASEKDAKESVERTILWAKRSKKEFDRICKRKKLASKPYLLGVIQGGRDKKLRQYCIEELIKIGFDGLGYGGEEKVRGEVNYELAEWISKQIPDNYFKYALGVGKPEDVVNMARIGWNIFDCVLPTRDARHKRLYVYKDRSISDIDLKKPVFYGYYVPDKEIHRGDKSPVSTACDCLLCTNYTRGYLHHLFREKEITALRLSTIHNLRFYSILMENLIKAKAKHFTLP